MRIGIFGGTFDPVHLGHLILAEQCREQGKLDQVWFVPAARPPHKQEQPLTSFDRRAEMLALAVAGQPAFQVHDLERRRAGPSYTVDTLTEIHEQHPKDDLLLLIGSDVLPDLAYWREPQRIVSLARLLVVARLGWPTWSADKLGEALQLPATEILPFQEIHAPLIDISSRDLRSRIARRQSVRYLVPRAIEAYIEAHHLYQADGGV